MFFGQVQEAAGAGAFVFQGYNGSAYAERMRLDSSGNLGIGTTTPGAKLQVYSTTSTVGNLLRGTGTTNGVDLQLNNSGGSLYVGVDNSTGSTTGTAYARFIYSSGNNPLQFYVFDSLKATIDSNGNLGIGTSSPLGSVEIVRNSSSGSGIAYPNIRLDNQNATGYTGIYFLNSGTGKAFFEVKNDVGALTMGTGGTERMRLDSSGNLLVGGTSVLQSAKITSYGSVSAQNGGVDGAFANAFVGVYSGNANEHNPIQTSVSSTGTSSGFRFKASDGGGLSTTTTVLDLTRTQTIFYTGGTERARIDSSGNLLVGTTTSALTSSGRGVVEINGSSSAVAALKVGNALKAEFYTDGTDLFITNDVNGAMRLYTNGSERARIDSSGNLLVGTTSQFGSGKVCVAFDGNGFNAILLNDTASVSGTGYIYFQVGGTTIGSITRVGATSAVAYNSTSDQRLKENIVDAPEFGSVIDSIKVRSYDWKIDHSHQRAGFIAQELVTVAPEAVHQPADPEAMMAVDYSKLVPMLVKEIQSLRARVAQLESKS